MRHEPKQTKIDAHERGITMSKKNITTASTATTTTTMTAAEFKQKSYDAYLAYVEFIEGKKSILETVEALSPLMSAYGFVLTADNLANLLTVKMTAYGKDKGEQAKKSKSYLYVPRFRQGWLEGRRRGSRSFQRGEEPCRRESQVCRQEAHESRIGSRNRRSARQAGSSYHRRKGGVTLSVSHVRPVHGGSVPAMEPPFLPSNRPMSR